MRSDDRRELLQLLRKHEGMSKAQAQAYIEQATDKSLSAALEKLRFLEAPSVPAPQPMSVPLAKVVSETGRAKKVPYTLLMHP